MHTHAVVFTGSRTLSHPFCKAQLCKSNVLMSDITHVHKLTIDKWDMYSRIWNVLKMLWNISGTTKAYA